MNIGNLFPSHVVAKSSKGILNIGNNCIKYASLTIQPGVRLLTIAVGLAQVT